ncbi:hypothetical protein [Bradyrhizobium sp. USDA 10063]
MPITSTSTSVNEPGSRSRLQAASSVPAEVVSIATKKLPVVAIRAEGHPQSIVDGGGERHAVPDEAQGPAQRHQTADQRHQLQIAFGLRQAAGDHDRQHDRGNHAGRHRVAGDPAER